MSAITLYDHQRNMIITTLEGTIRRADVLGFIDSMISMTEKYSCSSWLVDYGDAVFDLDVLDTYEIPRQAWDRISKIGPMAFKIRRAIVNKNGQENLNFLETTAHNYAQNLNVFKTREEAVQWLLL